MTKQEYDKLSNAINSLNWADYSNNLRGLISAFAKKNNLTRIDMLDFEGFQRCEILNEVSSNNTNCVACRGRGFINSHYLSSGKLYYQVYDCRCKYKNEEY